MMYAESFDRESEPGSTYIGYSAKHRHVVEGLKTNKTHD